MTAAAAHKKSGRDLLSDAAGKDGDPVWSRLLPK